MPGANVRRRGTGDPEATLGPELPLPPKTTNPSTNTPPLPYTLREQKT